MRICIVLIAVALGSGCSGDKKKKSSADPEINPLSKMSDQAACEALFARMGECAGEIETATVEIEGPRLKGFAKQVRKMTAQRKTLCPKQGPILRKEKHSPFVCYPRTGCASFASCIAKVAKAGGAARKQQMVDEARKARGK